MPRLRVSGRLSTCCATGCTGWAVLGGLPIGHGRPATAVPVGTMATLDADAGTLTVDPAVR